MGAIAALVMATFVLVLIIGAMIAVVRRKPEDSSIVSDTKKPESKTTGMAA